MRLHLCHRSLRCWPRLLNRALRRGLHARRWLLDHGRLRSWLDLRLRCRLRSVRNRLRCAALRIHLNIRTGGLLRLLAFGFDTANAGRKT